MCKKVHLHTTKNPKLKITARILDRLSGKTTRALEKVVKKARNMCSEEQCFIVTLTSSHLMRKGH